LSTEPPQVTTRTEVFAKALEAATTSPSALGDYRLSVYPNGLHVSAMASFPAPGGDARGTIIMNGTAPSTRYHLLECEPDGRRRHSPTKAGKKAADQLHGVMLAAEAILRDARDAQDDQRSARRRQLDAMAELRRICEKASAASGAVGSGGPRRRGLVARLILR
jgi:hypothetical protein